MNLLPIPIPSGFEAKVKLNDKIKEGDILASGTNSSEFIVNISNLLGVDPKKSKKLLKKNPGDRVEIGMVIAKKGGILGSSEVESSVNGTITRFDEETSDLVIASEGQVQEDIISPVDGEVTVCDNDKIVIKSNKQAFAGKRSVGEEALGEVFLIHSSQVDSLAIDEKVSGNVIFGKSFNRDAMFKALALNALGIVTIDLNDEDFENLRERKMKNPVIQVEEEIFSKLSKVEDKILVDGAKNLIIKI